MGVWTTEKWSKQRCVYAQFVEPAAGASGWNSCQFHWLGLPQAWPLSKAHRYGMGWPTVLRLILYLGS